VKFQEAFNKHAAAAIADLFTSDAVQVLDGERVVRFPVSKPSRNITHSISQRVPPEVIEKLIQVYAIGDKISAILE
jgi:hypothetical protein